MPELITISTGLALIALGGFAWDLIKNVGGNLAANRFQKIVGQASERFREGKLPEKHDLDLALRRALGQAARLLAYHLYDPQRGPMRDLLANFSTWPDFYLRFIEAASHNIPAGNAREHWLAALIDRSKKPEYFDDFPLDLVLNDHQITRVLAGESDPAFREHIHREFLAWVQRHVPEPPGAEELQKPPDFTAKVQHGWPASGPGGPPLAFYDIFCLFFREELTGPQHEAVFRAFSVNVLTGLKQDLAELQASLPNPQTLRDFTAVIRNFEDKEFDANYARFKAWTRRQNEKLYDFLRQEFAGINAHLDRQDQALTAIGQTTAEHRQSSAATHRDHKWTFALLILIAFGLVFLYQKFHVGQGRIEGRIAGFEKIVQAQLQQPSRPEASTPRLDFPRALREWASQHGITPEQAQFELEAWIAEVRQRSTDLSERARAEFLAQHFSEAALLSDQAAEDKFARSRALDSKSRQLVDEAVADLTRAGESLFAQQDYANALGRFLRAIGNAPREANPTRWAALQRWIGNCYWNLCLRVEPGTGNKHLQSALIAYNAALAVYTLETFPQDWAGIQNNLGNALCEQARRSQGAEVVRLFAEAVATFHGALKVRTREALPQAWALTQGNLGFALCSFARLSQGAEAARLVADAISACRAALEIQTLEALPRDWARTQTSLGIALETQASLSHAAAAAGLLGEAATAFRAALQVYTRNATPLDWAGIQINLGNVLLNQSKLLPEADATTLVANAVSAYRAALEVFTPEAMPQDWARTQHNLGDGLSEQASLNQGAEATRLFNEAVAVYRASLQVRTREAMPQAWAMTQNSLGTAIYQQAMRSQGAKAARLLPEAVSAYSAALEVYTREAFPQDWAKTQHNLGLAFYAQADLSQESEKRTLLRESIAAYRNALEILTKEHFPQHYETTSQLLAQAEAALKNLP